MFLFLLLSYYGSTPSKVFSFRYTPTFSWVNTAVIGFNQNVPSQWQLLSGTLTNFAISGMPTTKFGIPGKSPGSNAWASGDTQVSKMRAALSGRSDSWNVVSVDG